MAISYTSLTSGSDVVDGTSHATASVTPSANKLILLAAAIGDKDGSGSLPPTGVTGNGLTWVQVDTQDLDAFDGISIWRAMGASPTTGAVTITYGDTNEWCGWSLVEFDGVDTGGTNGSAAVVQSAKNSGSTVSSLTATLAAFGSVDNATYGAFLTYRDLATATTTHTQGTGFTQAHTVELQVGWRSTLSSQYLLANDTTVDASFSDTCDTAGCIAVEIKAAAGGVVAQIMHHRQTQMS